MRAKTKEKLACDRCDKDLTNKHEIELALEGQQAWEASARANGAEPRGIIPCENYVQCRGEMQLIKK